MRSYCHPERLNVDETWKLREYLLPLPGKGKGDAEPEDKFPRVSVIGNTSSGKTTLIRQLLGINPDMRQEGLLGITDSRSTVSNYEIIVDSNAEYYKAVISFYSEEKIDRVIDEILENKVLSGIKFEIDENILREILNINVNEDTQNEDDENRENERRLISSLKEINKRTREEIRERISELLPVENRDNVEDIINSGEFYDVVSEYDRYLEDRDRNYRKAKRILNDLLKSKNQNDRFDVTLGSPDWFIPAYRDNLDDTQQEQKAILDEFLDKFIEFYKSFHEENIEWKESERVNEFKEYYLNLIKDRFNDILKSDDISPYIDFISYEDFNNYRDELNNLPFPTNFNDIEADEYDIDVKEEWLSVVTIKMTDFDRFKEVMETFTSLNSRSFGKLLPSFVEGIRFRGKFTPDWLENNENQYNLVILDGEGAGQQPNEPLPKHLIEKFAISDLILLADKANPSFEQGTIEVIKNIITSGFSDNLIMTFSKLDLMQEELLENRIGHIWTAAGALSNISIGEKQISEINKNNLRKIHEGGNKRGFALYRLNKRIDDIEPDDNLNDMIPSHSEAELKENLKREYNRLIEMIWTLTYDTTPPNGITLSYDNFSDFFNNFIDNTLEKYKNECKKNKLEKPTHWKIVEAFSRRVAEHWNNYSYTSSTGITLNPIGAFTKMFQIAIREYLEENIEVTGNDDKIKSQAIDEIMKEGMTRIMDLFLIENFVREFDDDWREAYRYRGNGSNRKRINKIMEIFDGAFSLFEENLTFIKEDIENKVQVINELEEC